MEAEYSRDVGVRSRVGALVEELGQWSLVDLSHRYEEGMPYYPTHPRYFHELWDSRSDGAPATLYQLLLHEHCGTHVDAPAHFIGEDGGDHEWVDEIALSRFFGRAARLRVEDGPGEEVDIGVLEDFERRNGRVERGDVVLLCTGWDSRWEVGGTRRQYAKGWPSLTARFVDRVLERGMRAVGCDTLSPDSEDSETFYAHHRFLSNGVLIFENLANLDQLEEWSLFMAMPLKLGQGSGSPVRAVGWNAPRLAGRPAREG